MRHGSLFSGIGGFDLAAQWMGWENVFQVEIDPFCQKVLEKNFPGVKRYGDIKEFDGTEYRGAVDIISGGFPCQPFSVAGKRKGKEDNRFLWPEMLRVIREVQPAYVLGENVYGIVNWSRGLVFEQVCIDLENEGYQVQPVILPACAVDAPHRRDRVWFVAYSQGNNDRRTERKFYSENGRPVGELLSTSSRTSDGLRCEGVTPNASSKGGFQYKQKGQAVSNKERDNEIQTGGWKAIPDGSTGSGDSITNPTSVRWVQSVDRDQSEINHTNSKGNAWENFPTQSPLRDGDDGLPSRLVRSAIEAGGNAIVPQVAYEIFKAIEQCHERTTDGH